MLIIADAPGAVPNQLPKILSRVTIDTKGKSVQYRITEFKGNKAWDKSKSSYFSFKISFSNFVYKRKVQRYTRKPHEKLMIMIKNNYDKNIINK